jgi:hypothetical protein
LKACGINPNRNLTPAAIRFGILNLFRQSCTPFFGKMPLPLSFSRLSRNRFTPKVSRPEFAFAVGLADILVPSGAAAKVRGSV